MKSGNNITKDDQRYTATKVNVQSEDDETVIDEKAPIYLNVLNITKVQKSDQGNFSCHYGSESNYTFIEPVELAKVVQNSPARVEVETSKDTRIYCVIDAYPMKRYKSYIKWAREEDHGREYDWKQIRSQIINKTKFHIVNPTRVNMTLDIKSSSKKDNGTYYCIVDTLNSLPVSAKSMAEISIFVLEKPQVLISYVKPVGANKIFLNWTVMDGNAPVQQYYLMLMKEGDASFSLYRDKLAGNRTSFVVDQLEPDTNYKFRLSAQNRNGQGNPDETTFVKTLKKDPVFIPVIEAKGNTHSTVTIGWAPPPSDVLDYIQYYELIVSHANDTSSIIEEAVHPQNSRNLPYMFDNLETFTEYIFKVRACSELTRLCGNWSEPVTGTTSDGLSSEPTNVHVVCDYFNITRRSIVTVTWDPPKFPRGVIVTYNVELIAQAEYRNGFGIKANDTTIKGKSVEPIPETRQKITFEGVSPNTNYTVRISATTRTKKGGPNATAACTMPPTVPDDLPKEKFPWARFKSDKGEWIFKLFLPRINERNGPICCYRIYLVRVPERNQLLENLPENLDVQTYHDVHAVNNTKGGAYIAEVLAAQNFHKEVFLGDGENADRNHSLFEHDQSCKSCLRSVTRVSWRRPIKLSTVAPLNPSTESLLDEDDDEEANSFNINTTPFPSTTTDGVVSRRKRQHYSENLIAEEAKTPNPTAVIIDTKSFEIYDGPLDYSSYYTGFVEVIGGLN